MTLGYCLVAVNDFGGQPATFAPLKLALPVAFVELTNLPDIVSVTEPAGAPSLTRVAGPL